VYDNAGDPGELNADGYGDDPVDGADGTAPAELSYGQDGPLDGDLWLDTGHGETPLGPATVDTDGDGRDDTALVHDGQGDTVLYTDSDGDGHVDVATELRPDGEVVIADRAADDVWTTVQRGHLDLTGGYRVDDSAPTPFAPPADADGPRVTDTADDAHWAGWSGTFSETGAAAGVVRTDTATGQWISNN
jgi:hypothetical protein